MPATPTSRRLRPTTCRRARLEQPPPERGAERSEARIETACCANGRRPRRPLSRIPARHARRRCSMRAPDEIRFARCLNFSAAVTAEADVAVVGAGAAGLYAALCAARERASVVLVSATPLAQTASYWAQGGLAAALAADDSFELHLRDTERAGRALVRRSAAEILVREAPDCVRDLQAPRGPLRRRPLRPARARARGRALGPARRARRRQRDRPARRAPAVRARRRGADDHRARGSPRAGAVDRCRTAAAAWSATTAA